MLPFTQGQGVSYISYDRTHNLGDIRVNSITSTQPSIRVKKRLICDDGATMDDLEITSLDITNATTNTLRLKSDGTELTPAIAWESDPDSGIRRVASGHLTITSNGVGILATKETGVDVNGGLMVTGNVACTNLSIATTDAINLTSASPRIVLGDGVSATVGNTGVPAIIFRSSTGLLNTGIYTTANGNVAISCTGNERFKLNTSTLYTSGTLRCGASGSQAAPALQVTNTNIGFYTSGTTECLLGVANQERCKWNNTTGMTVSGAANITGLTTTATLKVGTGKPIAWQDFGTFTFATPLLPSTSNNVSVLWTPGIGTPSGTVSLQVYLINAANPDRITYGTQSVTSTGFNCFFYNNYTSVQPTLTFSYKAWA